MIEISAKELYEAARMVKQTEVDRLPVLNYAHLRLTDDGAILTTLALTNEGKEAKRSNPVHYCANGERWETCVPMVHKVTTETHVPHYKKSTHKYYPFLDYLRVMAEYRETLTMEFDPALQILTVKAGNSVSTFKCLDAHEFPPC